MSGVSTRQRDLSVVYHNRYQNWFNQQWNKTTYDNVVHSDQATTSFRSSVQDIKQDEFALEQVTYNPLFATDPDDKSDRGHEFDSTKRITAIFPDKFDFVDTYDRQRLEYQGILDPIVTSGGIVPGYTNVDALSDNDLKFFGTTAISKCEPTNPAASLSTFLGEIFLADREIPHFDSDTWLRFLTGGGHVGDLIGDTALLGEFGFKPFLNDVKKLMQNVAKSYNLVKQYSKDAGKPIRRRYTFDDIVTDSTYPGFLTCIFDTPYPYEGLGASTGIIYTQYSRTEMWFSGSFMYALPLGDDLISRFAHYNQLANQLLGSDFTPLTVWNLIPYSWLADWVVDIGNAISISNSMTQHGLVLRYGYLMRRTTTVNKMFVPASIGGKSRMITKTFSVVRKERRRSTPYGFGVNPDSFSPEQIAILLSLGLSRGLLTP